jgi:hypothetical protein
MNAESVAVVALKIFKTVKENACLRWTVIMNATAPPKWMNAVNVQAAQQEKLPVTEIVMVSGAAPPDWIIAAAAIIIRITIV